MENTILGGVAAVWLPIWAGCSSCQDNFNFTSFLWVGHAYPDLFGYVVDSAAKPFPRNPKCRKM